MDLRLSIGAVLLAAALACGPAAAEEAGAAADLSRVEADGSRTLAHETVIPTPAAQLWPLLSSSEGLMRWAAPLAAIDLRVGGIWESSYDPAGRLGDPGNIRNRVLAYEPERMLAIAIDAAPPDFPHADLARGLWTVITLEPVDAQTTRVRIAMLGFGEGEGFDALYGFFARGNAATLAQLRAAALEDAP